MTDTIQFQDFVTLVHQQQVERLKELHLDCQGNLDHCKVSYRIGKKYIHVIVGSTSKWMIEVKTGNIYGVKSWAKIHKGHFYGTLETFREYNWGDYYPTRIDGTTQYQSRTGGTIPVITTATTVIVPSDDGLDIDGSPRW